MAVSRMIVFLCVVFLVTLQTVHNSMLVNGDIASLIGGVCSKTLFPDECHICLNPAKSSSRPVDVKSLAGIAIDCCYSNSVGVDKLLKQYTDPQYALCLEKYDQIVQRAYGAQLTWRNKFYKASIVQLEKAQRDYQECLTNLTQPRYPEQLVQGLFKSRTSCDNSVGVLSQIGY